MMGPCPVLPFEKGSDEPGEDDDEDEGDVEPGDSSLRPGAADDEEDAPCRVLSCSVDDDEALEGEEVEVEAEAEPAAAAGGAAVSIKRSWEEGEGTMAGGGVGWTTETEEMCASMIER